MKNLVIVESPAKAKTIEGFLGKEFTVKSSFGHIRDLHKKKLSVDIDNHYKPEYIVPKDKQKLVNELKKLSKKAELIWLASDEDREGEAISWHLRETLEIPKEKIRRIVFHEITKKAILAAVQNPRKIDMSLVDGQQARRVLDRLVGYQLSPVLWRKVAPKLSAGRVQSVAVRLIVDRERAIESFESVSSFKVSGYFLVEGAELKAELDSTFKLLDEAVSFLRECEEASYSVTSLEKKPLQRNPSAPFTTSTLQQEASRKLGFSVSRTMQVAQKLYEQGKITYMRTDSVNLSEDALRSAKEVITGMYGERYVKTRKYTTRSKGAQEAHEAIRPTYMAEQTVKGDRDNQRLYRLIWNRTVASQMASAQIEKTQVDIDISGSDHKFSAEGEVIVFDGFLRVYSDGSSDQVGKKAEKRMLPPLKVGQDLTADHIEGIEKFSSPKPRYSEASLVKKLEDLGIGRPSTYAPTISTIIQRKYVVKESREGKSREFAFVLLDPSGLSQGKRTEMAGSEKSKLFPTDVGKVVNDFLVENFKDILDYNFTAQVEKEFDQIAKGELEWTSMIDQFYKPFSKTLETVSETAKKAKGQRLLGADPVSGRNVYVRLGKYGPMIQIGDAEQEEKPKWSSLREGQQMDTLTLEDALEAFKLPRQLGEFEGEELIVNIGRFGPYVRHGKSFASIKDHDPMTIEKSDAINLILEKREEIKKSMINEFQDGEQTIQVKKGKYGPYISVGKKNYRIPKDTEPESLTVADCKSIIEKQGTRPKRGARNKKK